MIAEDDNTRCKQLRAELLVTAGSLSCCIYTCQQWPTHPKAVHSSRYRLLVLHSSPRRLKEVFRQTVPSARASAVSQLQTDDIRWVFMASAHRALVAILCGVLACCALSGGPCQQLRPLISERTLERSMGCYFSAYPAVAYHQRARI